MRQLRLWALCLVLLLPYLAGWSPSPEDSSESSVEFGLGFGSYADVSRDCQGNVISVRHVPFSDFGGTVQGNWKLLRGEASAGLATVDFRDRNGKESVGYLAFRGGLNSKYLEMLAGPCLPAGRGFSGDNRIPIWPTGKIRLGKENGLSLFGSVIGNTPLYTGGGAIQVGISVRSDDNLTGLRLGLGVLPYDAAAFSLRYDFPFSTNWSMAMSGQYGTGVASEGGIGLTARYRW